VKAGPDGGAAKAMSSPFLVHVFPVSDFQDEDEKLFIFDLRDDSKARHLIAPKLTVFLPFEPFANAATILELRELLREEGKDALSRGTASFRIVLPTEGSVSTL